MWIRHLFVHLLLMTGLYVLFANIIVVSIYSYIYEKDLIFGHILMTSSEYKMSSKNKYNYTMNQQCFL